MIELNDRLDHVLYTRAALVPVEARVVERGRSDHFPVIAVFARRSLVPELRSRYGTSTSIGAG